MRTYIAGPMSGLPQYNKPAFLEAQLHLELAGREVRNPVHNGLPESAPWGEHMRADLRMLLDCECVHMLDGWQHSRGAQLEHAVAVSLGMRIEYEGPGDR